MGGKIRRNRAQLGGLTENPALPEPSLGPVHAGGHGEAMKGPGINNKAFTSENIDLYGRVVGFRIEFFQRCGGYSLRFIDDHGHVVADFPWWDNTERDLRSWTLSDIPLGNAAWPYSDRDQCWWIVIWQNTDRVYIAESEDENFADSESYENFHRTFWVPVEDYLAAWEVALAWARTVP
jgi:hypothetical protein